MIFIRLTLFTFDIFCVDCQLGYSSRSYFMNMYLFRSFYRWKIIINHNASLLPHVGSPLCLCIEDVLTLLSVRTTLSVSTRLNHTRALSPYCLYCRRWRELEPCCLHKPGCLYQHGWMNNWPVRTVYIADVFESLNPAAFTNQSVCINTAGWITDQSVLFILQTLARAWTLLPSQTSLSVSTRLDE